VATNTTPEKEPDIGKKEVFEILGANDIKVNLNPTPIFPNGKSVPLPPNLLEGMQTSCGRSPYHKIQFPEGLEGIREQPQQELPW